VTWVILSQHHLQRLPVASIKRAHVIGKVRFEKHPALAHLGGRNTASLGTAAQFFGMQLEETGGLFEIKRLHVTLPMLWGDK
jgi:hypothetical protein